jgi:hypothetical protein
MSQRAFQSVLSRIVLEPDFRDSVRSEGETVLGGDLTLLERQRLTAVARDAGLDITRTLHKAFRLGKLLMTLPYTCALLGEDQLAQEVSNFWRERPPRSFYFLEEGLAFCEYLALRITHGLQVEYLDEVVTYERAALELQRAAIAGDRVTPRRINFRHDPQILLACLAKRERPCAVAEGFFPLIGKLSADNTVEWSLPTDPQYESQEQAGR